jgi:TolB protein
VIRTIAIVAALALAAGCAGGDADGTGGDQIAFTVNRDGWGEIWVMAADGTARTRLTELEPRENDAAGSTSPAWSPDGDRIVYAAQIGTTAEDSSQTEIYVMRADGTERRGLTENDVFDGFPSWSPDGTRIAFTRAGTAGGGLFVMDADGGDEQQLTRTARTRFDLAPAWSPDGSQIAFTRIAPSAGPDLRSVALYAVTPDDGRTRKLADAGADTAWSPNGRRLAFVSYRDRFGQTCFHECSTSGEIYLLDLETGSVRRLARSQADDRSPAWSPDGRLVAFVSDRSNRQEHANEIYVMSPSGGDLRRLTRNDVWDLEPAWRP